MLQRGRFFMLTLAFLAVSFAGAQAQKAEKKEKPAEWPVTRGASKEPVPYKFDFKSLEKVPKEFLDDAPACTIYSGVNFLLEEDGTVNTINHEVLRFNSRKAIDRLGEYRSITYDPAYETLTLNEARVIKADGKSVPVEPKHVQLRDAGTDFLVYDHSKQVVISFPTLEVNDLIEVKWTTRGKNPEYQGQFFFRYTFGDDRYPVVCDEMYMGVPKGKPLTYGTVGGQLEPEIKEENGQKLYHWKVTNRAQLPQDDNLPSREELRQQVALSTFASWDEVLKWKQNLRKDCWECTDEVKKLVKEITKDLKTQEEKARALTYWTRRHIRYVSVGDKHDYTPHVPSFVLENRYGDCKDQGQFLAVMLKEAGIPVALATLAVQDDGQIMKDVPSPWGTHAILLVTIDGKEHWIDTTIRMAGWDFLPHDDRGRVCYVVDDKGLKLMNTPKRSPETNHIEQTTRISIGADGSSRNERASEYTGSAALSRRHEWVDVPTGERRRVVSSDLQDAHSRARFVSLNLDEKNLRNYDVPVKSRVVFEVPGHFSTESDREGSITDSAVWGRILAVNLDYNRDMPLDLVAPFESIHRFIITLSPALSFEELPKNANVESKWGSFKVTVKSDADKPRQLEVVCHTRLENVRVEPKDFDEFRKFHQAVNKHYRIYLPSKPTENLEDAKALEAYLAVAPGDIEATTVLTSLYLKNDKPAEARRVLKRARHYCPEAVSLIDLSIKSAGDPKEEEKIYRELAEKFPDEVKHTLSLAQALVKQDNVAEARKLLRPIIKKGEDEERAQAYFIMARTFLAQDKAKEALKNFDHGAEADENAAAAVPALLLKASIHEKLDKLDEAESAYKEAMALDPINEDLLASLVRLAIARKKTPDALEHLRHFTLVADKDCARLAQAADFNLQLGRHEEALDLATRASQKDATPAMHRTLGLVHYRQGRHEKALTHLSKAELDPDVLVAMVRSQLALGQLQPAIQKVQEAGKIKKTPPEVLQVTRLARALAERRESILKAQKPPVEKAEAWAAAVDRFVCAEQAHVESRPAAEVEGLLNQCFAKDTDLGPAFALRGLLTLEKGKVIKALADAEKAVKLSPDDPTVYYVRGRIRHERGDKEALADLTKAAELTRRKDPRVLHALAAALLQAGKKDDALATQREAAKLKPDDKEIAEQLKELENGKSGSAGR